MKYKKEYKDEIIYCLAEHACKHITRKIIRRLQQLTVEPDEPGYQIILSAGSK
jgi:hypothetical protein